LKAGVISWYTQMREKRNSRKILKKTGKTTGKKEKTKARRSSRPLASNFYLPKAAAELNLLSEIGIPSWMKDVQNTDSHHQRKKLS